MPIPLLSDHPAAAAQEKAMALMLAKLYTALREAGADDDKAREAAEEVASFENRLANVEASLMVLKWMVGFNLILTVAIVGMLFFVLANELAANAAATTDALFNPHPNAAEMRGAQGLEKSRRLLHGSAFPP
jgi:hypothetical protein